MPWHRVNQIGTLKPFAERCDGGDGTRHAKWFARMRNEDYTTVASRATVYTASILRCKMLVGKIPNPFKSAPSRCRLRDGIAEWQAKKNGKADKNPLYRFGRYSFMLRLRWR